MILAAGKGTRLRPITYTLPKPLIDVNGLSLIERHLENLSDAGFSKALINVSYLGHLIHEKLGLSYKNMQLEYSFEPESPLETAGGIAFAQPWLPNCSPFLVINADIWCDWPLRNAFQASTHLKKNKLLAHLILVNNVTQNGGDFFLSKKFLSRFDKGDANSIPLKLTYSGIGIYSPLLFTSVVRGTRLPLTDLLFPAIDEKLVSGEFFSGYWADAGTRQRLSTLRKTLTKNHQRL